MIIDTFTFYNEIEMLLARLEYLWDTVDFFVLVEANVTHSGKPKDFIFNENKNLFSKYMSKIKYLPYYFDNTINNLDFSISNTNDNSAFWMIEKLQRNHISSALHNFPNDALILVSDVDEIPNIDAISFAKSHLSKSTPAIAFSQIMFYYDLNHQLNEEWVGSCAILNEEAPNNVQYYRSIRWNLPRVNIGGWHLSYFGDVSYIVNKISNLAHQENNTPQNVDAYYIIKKIKENKDLFDRPGKSFIAPNIATFPSKFQTVFSKFQDLSKNCNFPPDVIDTDTDKFSVIIPTMWKFEPFLDFVADLVKIPIIGEIIIINNDVTKTPTHPVLSNNKVRVITFKDNIFVNPAWNLGVEISQYEKICIINDDIIFDTKVFNRVHEFLIPGRVLGLNGSGPNQTQVSTGAIEFEFVDHIYWYGFGILMFINKRDWIPIPAGLLVGYGDNWIAVTMKERFNQMYLISNMFFYTPFSVTVKTLDTNAQKARYEVETKIYENAINTFFNTQRLK